MNPAPLKNKVRREIRDLTRVYREEDVKVACEWLKENMELRSTWTKGQLKGLIEEAFPDCYEKEAEKSDD